jgi:hypothetical protein
MSEVQCKNCQPTTIDLKITVPQPNTGTVSALPKADFLVVTWTAAETDALGLVLGKNVYSFEGEDSNNFTPLLLSGLHAPSGERFHGYFFQAKVNGKTVVCLKSEFHPKVQPQDTTIFFEKLIGAAASRNFKYVVTSGTAGGIWATLDVGDVVVTNSARFGMTMPVEQQALRFTGVSNVVGGNPPSGYSNWYDYVNGEILKNDSCVNGGLLATGGRSAASGKPAIYYKPSAANLTDVVTNSRISDDECGRINTYRTLGATLDENDAYVAASLKAVDFQNWVSIRNVSDLPCAPSSDNQYDNFGFCSSINGAYAVWSFVMGH